MKHVMFKVQKEKQDDWRSWCEYLHEHQSEAKETMHEENCVYERPIIYGRDEDYYVVGSVQKYPILFHLIHYVSKNSFYRSCTPFGNQRFLKRSCEVPLALLTPYWNCTPSTIFIEK